jgi:hypothetical protein
LIFGGGLEGVSGDLRELGSEGARARTNQTRGLGLVGGIQGQRWDRLDRLGGDWGVADLLAVALAERGQRQHAVEGVAEGVQVRVGGSEAQA